MRALFPPLLLTILLPFGSSCDRTAERARLRALLSLELPPPRAGWAQGPTRQYPGYAVSAVQYELTPGFPIGALLFQPDAPSEAAAIVAHGHYGMGKNAEESQEIAHGLASIGFGVLVVDTPGVEEGDSAARQIHFEAGAHNRAWLLAGGTSALALQIAALRRGLDLLAATGARRFAATGASGGAMQALYLMLVDERVSAAVLASFPKIPRAPGEAGCLCDALPGWPGPSPELLASLDRPTLWLSELDAPRPDGLGWRADYEIMEGPHSYTRAMQDRALGWLGAQLDVEVPPTVLHLEHQDLHMPRLEGAITALPLHPERQWRPAAADPLPWSIACAGSGPVVLLAGADPSDEGALQAAGLETCMVTVESPAPEDEGDSQLLARPMADRVVASLAAAASESGARGAWGRRAWGLPVSALNLPFVVADPLLEVNELRLEDPTWIHVPGAWWGVIAQHQRAALRTGDETTTLAAALAATLSRAP